MPRWVGCGEGIRSGVRITDSRNLFAGGFLSPAERFSFRMGNCEPAILSVHVSAQVNLILSKGKNAEVSGHVGERLSTKQSGEAEVHSFAG